MIIQKIGIVPFNDIIGEIAMWLYNNNVEIVHIQGGTREISIRKIG